mmetsp:Transcript_16995/g.49088  ORF Transcript_16995/g.49088 Transcript_16995/m.49088 type:complete len:213 (-) Transcript_16995:1121-1759(-)
MSAHVTLGLRRLIPVAALHVLHLDLIRRPPSECLSANDDEGISLLRHARQPNLVGALRHKGVGVLQIFHDERVARLQDSEGLTCDGLGRRQDGHGHAGTELGNHPGGRSRFREDDDRLGADIDGRLHGRRGNRLGRAETVLLDDRIPDGLVQEVEVDGTLGFAAGGDHDLHGRLEVGAVGGFAGKHDAVRAVEHGVGNIGTFGAGGAGVDDH